jgi:hypothetical protein
MELGKYSFGTGDRFAHQGEAQLQGSILAKNQALNSLMSGINLTGSIKL